MKTRRMVTNTIVAALYVVMTGLFSFMSFGAVQFRISEMLNHLVGYHKNYKYGVLAGVFISNLIFSTLGVWDLIFGFGQTFICFMILEKLFKPGDSQSRRMILTAVVFTVTMAFVAAELYFVLDLPFWFSYATTALGEATVLFLSIPLMTYLNKLIGFTEKMNE